MGGMAGTAGHCHWGGIECTRPNRVTRRWSGKVCRQDKADEGMHAGPDAQVTWSVAWPQGMGSSSMPS
jgi:hypothetical protein